MRKHLIQIFANGNLDSGWRLCGMFEVYGM